MYDDDEDAVFLGADIPECAQQRTYMAHLANRQTHTAEITPEKLYAVHGAYPGYALYSLHCAAFMMGVFQTRPSSRHSSP